MTNGEKIQKDFKGCEACEPIIEDNIIHVFFADKKDSAIGFDWDWWNAEYKEPTTENDLGVDAVSRQAVLDLIADYDLSMGQVVKGIHALPSVTPIRPKGHWILTVVEGNRVWHCNCSECGKDPQDYVGGSENWWLIKSKLPKFCPSCGSDNSEGEE